MYLFINFCPLQFNHHYCYDIVGKLYLFIYVITWFCLDAYLYHCALLFLAVSWLEPACGIHQFVLPFEYFGHVLLTDQSHAADILEVLFESGERTF